MACATPAWCSHGCFLKSAASFLLNCFYSNGELAGMNLTGANGKQHPDNDIIECIIGMFKKMH